MLTPPLALWGLWDACARVYTHLSISVLVLHHLGGLCTFFPRKKLPMLFPPQSEMGDKGKQFLAWQGATLMIL